MLTLIIALSVAGTLALILEVFLPGGILGVTGGICIAAAAVITLTTPDLAELAFAARLGIATSIIIFATVAFAVSMKHFHRTKVGKLLTLSAAADGSAEPETPGIEPGTLGTAATNLSPLGTVNIDGTTTDALSESGFIPAGTSVRVTKIESGSIYVVHA